MATRIPIPQYQQQRAPSLETPGARAPGVAVQDFTGQALGQLAGGLERVGGALQQQNEERTRRLEQQQAESDRAWASQAGSNAVVDWQQRMIERQEAAQPGAPDFTPTLLKEFDEYRSKSLENAPNEQSRRFLGMQFDHLRQNVGGQAVRWESGQRKAYQLSQYQSSIEASANAIFQDPSLYDERRAATMAALNTSTMEPDEKLKLIAKADQALAYAAAASIARSNPDAIVGPVGAGGTAVTGVGGAGGFAGADAFIAKKEGGYTANDNGRGPTNFGINSQANPDVDVAKLTPESASQLRKTRYWDAIQADALPPSLQPVAYNFAIQAGPGAANRLLRESGGNAAKFNDLAKEYYADIARNNPAQAKNVPMWQKRSDEALAMGGPAVAGGVPLDNPALARLPFETRIQVFNQARTQQAQNMALARAQLGTRLQDAQAAAADGRTDPTPLSLDTLVRAYGPVEAPALYQQYRDGQQMGADVANLKGMPASDIVALVRARTPSAGPGYAAMDRDHQILQSAANRVLQQRDADPAAYVVANSPAVNVALQAFAANPSPQTAQAYSQAAVAEQERLGIAKPQILTKQQADAITNQINANSGAQADNVIQQQAQLWGNRWGDVFGQLKDITPVAKVLGYLGNSVDTATRQQVLAAANTKLDALKDGLNGPDIKAAEAKMQALSQPFAATMAYSRGGASTFSALYDSANRLALTYLRQGMNPGDAATKAFSSIMGNQFAIRDTARIPQEFDADRVMTSARGIMTDLPKLELTVPPAPKGMRPEDAKALYASNLRSNGKWITSADGKGLVLFDPVSQTIVTTRDGKPVGGQFETLAAKPIEQVSHPTGPGGELRTPTLDVQGFEERRRAAMRAAGIKVE